MVCQFSVDPDSLHPKQQVGHRLWRPRLRPFSHLTDGHMQKGPEHASMGNELMNECNSMNVIHFYVIYYNMRLSLNTCPGIKREPRGHVTY